MGLWPWKKKNKPEPELEPEKSLPELINEYKTQIGLLSLLNAGKTKPLPDHFYDRFKKIEQQIIAHLPDKFQQEVFQILARHKFDITEFLRDEDWQTSFKIIARKTTHYLHYGAPYPEKPEWPPLPCPGNEFYYWMIQQSKSDDPSKRVENILVALEVMFGKGEILGHSLGKSELGYINMCCLAIIGGEWRKHSAVLIDIYCELDQGDEFLKTLLGLPNAPAE
ncbi:MAG: hypothetical protein V1668_01280 [Patescibacteria group bacterium]